MKIQIATGIVEVVSTGKDAIQITVKETLSGEIVSLVMTPAETRVVITALEETTMRCDSALLYEDPDE